MKQRQGIVPSRRLCDIQDPSARDETMCIGFLHKDDRFTWSEDFTGLLIDGLHARESTTLPIPALFAVGLGITMPPSLLIAKDSWCGNRKGNDRPSFWLRITTRVLLAAAMCTLSLAVETESF